MQKKKPTMIVPSRNLEDYPVVVSTEILPPFFESMAKRLKTRVVGQDRAIRKIIRMLTVAAAGLNDPKRPLGVIFAAGPSGAGKTHCAKELAYAWIGPPKKNALPYLLIPCGSLNERHEKSILTGAPPGYVGFDRPSILERIGDYEDFDPKKELDEWFAEHQQFFIEITFTHPEILAEMKKRLKKKIDAVVEDIEDHAPPPRCVVIFDEIEKASIEVQEALLNVLEEGVLPLHNNQGVVDFRGTILFFTTNVGTKEVIGEYLQEKNIGFDLGKSSSLRDYIKDGSDEEDSELDQAIYQRVMREIENPGQLHFLPEFIGRVGKPIVFRMLRYSHYRDIFRLMFQEQIAEVFLNADRFTGVLQVVYTEELEKFLIEEGINPLYGARALRGVLERYIRAELAIPLLNQTLLSGDIVLLDVVFERPFAGVSRVRKGTIVVRRMTRPGGIELKPFQIQKHSRKSAIKETLDTFLDSLWEELKNKKNPKIPAE